MEESNQPDEIFQYRELFSASYMDGNIRGVSSFFQNEETSNTFVSLPVFFALNEDSFTNSTDFEKLSRLHVKFKADVSQDEKQEFVEYF
jgi:hypothetical protein